MKSDTALLSDKDILYSVRDGNVEHFDILVNRYKDRLLNFVFRFTNDYQTSEDIMQETFLRVFTKCGEYRAIAHFSTWLFTIAGNLAKSELRRRKRWKYLVIDSDNDNQIKYDIPDPRMKPDQIAAFRILDERVQKAIDTLNIKYKEILILRDIDGMSYQQISEITGLQVGTIKSRVSRARKRLQRKLKGHSPGDELFQWNVPLPRYEGVEQPVYI